jgi:membrane-associated phospholipid phosphatase
LKTFQKNIGPLLAFFLFFLMGSAFLAFYSNLEIQRYINSFYNAEANCIFMYITRLAEGWLTIPLLIFLFSYNWRNAIYIGISYATSSILVAVLKRFVFFQFKRPHGFKELVKDENYKWLLNTDMPEHLSFPSGHTTVAFCVFFGLALIIPNKKIGISLVTLAALIGFSRTYLSYHFLMDLVAGSFLGVATAFGIYFLLRKKLRL